jgi:hypothetical protein
MPAPLFAWGAEEVLTGASWTIVNSATRALSGTVPNPFGLIENVYTISNPAASQSALQRAVTVPAAPRHVLPIFLRSNGTVNAGIQFSQGSTSGTLQINLNGSGDVTSIVQESATGGASTRGAAIKVSGPVAGGAAWYLILAEFAGITPGTGNLRLYPNLTGFASAGQTLFYLRPVFTHGYSLDSALAQPIARGGSSAVRSPSGVEDAWDYGTDELLTGVLRWMPRDFIPDPASSGYDGNGTDLVGVGCRSLLRAGRQRLTIRYVRDRTDCTAFVDGYLTDPYDSASALVEPDGTISQPITLKSTTPYRGEL